MRFLGLSCVREVSDKWWRHGWRSMNVTICFLSSLIVVISFFWCLWLSFFVLGCGGQAGGVNGGIYHRSFTAYGFCFCFWFWYCVLVWILLVFVSSCFFFLVFVVLSCFSVFYWFAILGLLFFVMDWIAYWIVADLFLVFLWFYMCVLGYAEMNFTFLVRNISFFMGSWWFPVRLVMSTNCREPMNCINFHLDVHGTTISTTIFIRSITSKTMFTIYDDGNILHFSFEKSLQRKGLLPVSNRLLFMPSWPILNGDWGKIKSNWPLPDLNG